MQRQSAINPRKSITDDEFDQAIASEEGVRAIIPRLCESNIPIDRLGALLQRKNSCGASIGMIIAHYLDTESMQQFFVLLERCSFDVVTALLKQQTKSGWRVGTLIARYQNAEIMQRYLEFLEKCRRDNYLTAAEVSAMLEGPFKEDTYNGGPYCKDYKTKNLMYSFQYKIHALQYKDEMEALIKELGENKYSANQIPGVVKQIEEKMHLMLVDIKNYITVSGDKVYKQYFNLFLPIIKILHSSLAADDLLQTIELPADAAANDHVLGCFKCYQESYQKVGLYKQIIRMVLDSLKCQIDEKTKNMEWKIMNIRGWISSDTKPRTVKVISSLLEQLKTDNSNVLDVYEKILTCLMGRWRPLFAAGDQTAEDFYIKAQKQLQGVTFIPRSLAVMFPTVKLVTPSLIAGTAAPAGVSATSAAAADESSMQQANVPNGYGTSWEPDTHEYPPGTAPSAPPLSLYFFPPVPTQSVVIERHLSQRDDSGKVALRQG